MPLDLIGGSLAARRVHVQLSEKLQYAVFSATARRDG